MKFVSSYKEYLFTTLILFFVSSDFFGGIHGLENKQQQPTSKLVVINHELCHSCTGEVSSLKDVKTFSSSQLVYLLLASK